MFCVVLCFIGSVFCVGYMCVGSSCGWFYVLLVQVMLVLCLCGSMFSWLHLFVLYFMWFYVFLVLCFLGSMYGWFRRCWFYVCVVSCVCWLYDVWFYVLLVLCFLGYMFVL